MNDMTEKALQEFFGHRWKVTTENKTELRLELDFPATYSNIKAASLDLPIVQELQREIERLQKYESYFELHMRMTHGDYYE